MSTLKSLPILLPKNCDWSKWAVVACDQFTSQRKYWADLKDFVGTDKSALNIIFPEVYLEDSDADERIETINKTMDEYLSSGTFKEIKDSFILVKRDTKYGFSRLGLVAPVDLEDYCFTHPSRAHIKSTEGVVIERIPPRLKIRENAPVELPHIMLLIDDIKKSVIEPLYEKKDSLEKLYDFDLNMGGGHLTGYRVDAKEVLDIFEKYEEEAKTLYGKKDNEFIFAVGDGNHSLATAQAHWNKIKEGLSDEEKENHPARYALCEIENLYDDGIVFEPIHRFIFNAGDEFVSYLKDTLKGSGTLEMFGNGKEYTLNADDNSAKEIYDIQYAVDEYLKSHKDLSVDYIHGMDNLKEIAKNNKGIAIIMPKIKKDELFPYVLKNGTLCRKSFSMGEAEEKRYYTEAKKIK
ncbi:MAG: DUF1015 domain-containing protein [Clostridia bacterium]|nr:DUF1015 domain-containing protein [Clostridia bacterium]